MNYPNNGQQKPGKPDCALMYRRLFSYFAQNYYRIANTYIYRWESDFFCKTKAGYSIEVEVKISRSDFFADFKKTEKHELLKNYKNGQVFMHGHFREINKCIPNRFFYAIPEGLVKIEEIPAYAGVLWLKPHPYYKEEFRFECGKEAPLLHKNKQDLNAVLLEKFYWQSINNRVTIANLHERLKEKQDFINKHLKGYQLEFNGN